MLKSLFKYTIFRPAFFDDFLIRSSQKYALNDPFELTPGSIDLDPSITCNAYYDYSVFSLSETKNNLLMWSHYADNHKGIVIEFDANQDIFERKYFKNEYVLNFIHHMASKKFRKFPNGGMYVYDFEEEVVIDTKATERHRLVKPGKPHRVLYNPERPNFDLCDNLLDHFLVKSDSWLYEKEHRIILPLLDVDKLVLPLRFEDQVTESFWLQDSLVKKQEDGKINFYVPQDVIEDELMESSRGAYINIYQHHPKKFKELCDLLKRLTYENFLLEVSKEASSVFLYKINPESIKAIYMGSKMIESDKLLLTELVRENSKLNHVRIFKSEISKTRFELNFNDMSLNRSGGLF